MGMQQLDPPLRLETPLGTADCHFLWSEGEYLEWGCFQRETGECWWWPNQMIRLSPSISEGRGGMSQIAVADDVERLLAPHRSRYRAPRKAAP